MAEQLSFIGVEAWYCWQPYSGTPYLCINDRASNGSPPFSQVPTPQFNNTCGDKNLITTPFDLIDAESAIAWVTAKAQLESQ